MTASLITLNDEGPQAAKWPLRGDFASTGVGAENADSARVASKWRTNTAGHHWLGHSVMDIETNVTVLLLLRG